MDGHAHAQAAELIAEACALLAHPAPTAEALASMHDALVSCLADVADPALADDVAGVATALDAHLDDVAAPPQTPALTG